MNKSKVLRSSRAIVDTSDSDESDILDDNVNKLLNPSEYKFRRPINFFNNVEQNPQKLRKSIITRALQNVISSTPMPSKHTRNFIDTDISLDLSPIDGNYEQIQNCHEIQEDKILTNNTNKLKSKSIVISISDSENNENDYPQNNHSRKNTSKRFDPETTEKPADMMPLSSSRNNYNKKENSKCNGDSYQRKTRKPQKLSNSFTQSVLWKRNLRSSDLIHNDTSKLNNSKDVTFVENQMKTNSKLDLYFDNKLNSDKKKNISLAKSDIKSSDSKLSAKKLSFASACTEPEKQDTLKALEGLRFKELSAQVTCNSGLISEETTMKKGTETNMETKKNRTKKTPPKPAPRKIIATRQSRACNCEDKKVTEIATSPCSFIAEQNEVLHDSVDKQIDNLVVTKGRLNGTRIPLLSGGDIHEDEIVKEMIDIATSPCSFEKKKGSPKESGSTKQCEELVAKTMTSIATSPHKFDKALETNSLQTSKNRLKNNNISKCDAIQENITGASKIIENNSKLCDSGGKTKSIVDIGTTPCSLKQEKMKRLLQLVQNLSNARNKEISSHSAIEDNKKMMSKEIQTSTEAISSKENPFKNFGRNISTQTIAEQYGRSLKLQEIDNKSDCTNESHLLREFEDDMLFRTVPPESNFIFSDEDDYMLEDSNKNCPWRLSEDFAPFSEPRMNIKLNFLRSAQKIQEEKESLINNDRRLSINLSNNQKISVKKGTGRGKRKSNKFRQYSRRPFRPCPERNRRSSVASSSLSSTFSKELQKRKSLIDSKRSRNSSNFLFTKELPNPQVSEQFSGESSTIIGKNATQVTSEMIQSSGNRSSILNHQLSSKLSVESGQGNSINEHSSEHDVNAQPLENIEASQKQFSGVSSPIIGKNATRVTSEMIQSSGNRSSILNHQLSSKFSVESGQKNSINEHNSAHDVDAQPLGNIEASQKLIVMIERISVMANKNSEQSKYNMLSPESNDKSMSLQFSEKNKKTQENKEHPSKRQSLLINSLEADTSSPDKLIRKLHNNNTSISVSPRPVSEIPSNQNKNDFRNFEDLAMPLDESFKEMPRISKKVNNSNCDMGQEELLEKCNEELPFKDSKERGSKSKLKNTSKSCGVYNLDCDGPTGYELLEKRNEVPEFKVPKKRVIKPKLRNRSESSGVSLTIGHADTTTDLDSDHSIGIRRSGRERKPVRHLTDMGVIVTHSVRDLQYWDVQKNAESKSRTSQFSTNKTSRKTRSKVKEVQGTAKKVRKRKTNTMDNVTVVGADQNTNDVTSGEPVGSLDKNTKHQSPKMQKKGEIDNRNSDTVLNLEIPSSSFSNVRADISYESQLDTTLTNENIDQIGISHPNNENVNSRQTTVDSGRSTLLTFEESNRHSIQKTGKVNKDYKRNGKISNKISKVLSRSRMHCGQFEIADNQCGVDVANIEDHSTRRETFLQTKCKESDYVKVLGNEEAIDLKYVHKNHEFVHESNKIMMTDSLKKSNYPIVGGYLKLPPGGKKMLHIPKSHSLFYFVIEGEGHIQVQNSLSNVQKMDHFIVPEGIAYSIWNNSLEDPLLLSCVKMASRTR